MTFSVPVLLDTFSVSNYFFLESGGSYRLDGGPTVGLGFGSLNGFKTIDPAGLPVVSAIEFTSNSQISEFSLLALNITPTNITPIPEPALVALVAPILGGLLYFQRRGVP